MDKNLRVFQKSFLTNHSFFGKNAKICFLDKSEGLYQVQVQFVINRTRRLQKTPIS